jgi:hypothetical protein
MLREHLTNLIKGLNKSGKKVKLVHLGRLPPAQAISLGNSSHALDRGRPDSNERSLISCDLKTALVLLVLPNFDKHFEVVTDACEGPPAIGGVLLQIDHPIAFDSCKLSGVELNDSQQIKRCWGLLYPCENGGVFWKASHSPKSQTTTPTLGHSIQCIHHASQSDWLEDHLGTTLPGDTVPDG